LISSTLSSAAVSDSVTTSDVIITEALKELRKNEFAIPIQIFDAQYFQRQQITNVQDALRMITGIQSNIDGALDGSGDIEINGQEGSYTLVMLDGISISGGNANKIRVVTFGQNQQKSYHTYASHLNV
jgi:outer membrane receptor for ferrienterochelin and colicins